MYLGQVKMSRPTGTGTLVPSSRAQGALVVPSTISKMFSLVFELFERSVGFVVRRGETCKLYGRSQSDQPVGYLVLVEATDPPARTPL